MSYSELEKRISNMILEGTVSQVRRSAFGDEIRAEVFNSGDEKRVTDWLPIVNFADSRVKRYDPIQVGDSVVILSGDGKESWRAVAIMGRWSKSVAKPSLANETTSVAEFADGSVIAYDTAAKKLFVSLSGEIDATIAGAANIEIAGSAAVNIGGSATISVGGDLEVSASAATITASEINLGAGGAGVVTGACQCLITGTPHSDISGVVKAAK